MYSQENGFTLSFEELQYTTVNVSPHAHTGIEGSSYTQTLNMAAKHLV